MIKPSITRVIFLGVIIVLASPSFAMAVNTGCNPHGTDANINSRDCVGSWKTDATDAEGYEVIIEDRLNNAGAYAAYITTSGSGNALNNRLVVRSTGVLAWSSGGAYVFGGNSVAAGNSLYVDGGSITDGSRFYGGRTLNGDVYNNILYLDQATVSGSGGRSYYYGGLSDGAGNAYENTAIIKGTVGFSSGNQIYGGRSQNSGAYNNTAVIDSSVVEHVSGGTGGGTGGVYKNTAILRNSTVLSVHGGESGTGASGNVYNNSVYIDNSKVTSFIYGGRSADGSSYNNLVSINGGTADSNVYGGYVTGAGTEAANNLVLINGGTINSDVYGGRVTDVGANAIRNMIRISGSPVSFSATGTTLWGGEGGADSRTGNTLEIHNSGLSVRGIKNFQNYLFYLPSTIRPDDVVLSVNDSVDLSTPVGQAETQIGVLLSGGRTLNVGEKVTLVDVTGGGTVTTDNDLVNNIRGMQGGTLNYNFILLNTGTSVIATVQNIEVKPESRSLLSPRTSALMLLNMGSDLIVEDVVREARHAAGLSDQGLNAGDAEQMKGGLFAAVRGGQMHYQGDGRTTLNGMNLSGGLSMGGPVLTGSALGAAFFEAGWGSNSGKNDLGISGDGTESYYGVGLLGYYEENGIYVETSGRLGKIETQYNGGLTDGNGDALSYKVNNNYYGMHGGVGYKLMVGEITGIDLSSKYIWTYQEAKNTEALTDPLQLNATNSQRWRSGARVNVAVSPAASVYLSGHYEHEFQGGVTGKTYGFDIPSVSMKGGTGIVGLGVNLGSLKDSARIDAGVQGYAGKRDGLTASIKAGWTF